MSDQPNPATETERYIVLRPIWHGPIRIEPGVPVVFTRAQALSLLQDGAIKPEVTASTEDIEAVDLSKPAPEPKKSAK